MCGIVGILSCEPVLTRLLQGLSRLEYRGYDSAGIATVAGGQLHRQRSPGKLRNLETLVAGQPLPGNVGIGHTRWATHGKANTENAHPHANPHIAVVHNGIIENFSSLKRDLQNRGYHFESETDTEVVVHLIDERLGQGCSPLQAVQETLGLLQGAFALVILFRKHPDLLVAARRGSPLVVGKNSSGDLFLASDALALAGWISHLSYLEEGDLVVLERTTTGSEVHFYKEGHSLVDRAWRPSQLAAAAISKAEYSHFMLKEIFEQPTVLSDSVQVFAGVEGTELRVSLDLSSSYTQIILIACGTSYYAGMVAKYWFEKYFQIPTQVEIASEFRYRQPWLDTKALYIFLSQSGETIDTLAALELVKNYGGKTLGIVNVPESSIARQADQVVYTLAGPEIGVASTKAFTAQLATLMMIGLKLETLKNPESVVVSSFLKALRHIPAAVSQVLQDHELYHQLSAKISQARHALYLGRGVHYPIALEGALKLKEISYIHAEGYAAGELKHGPIALIDDQIPVIVLAPCDEWFEKTVSNIQEVMARHAKLLILTDAAGAAHLRQEIAQKSCVDIMVLPTVEGIVTPFIYSIAVQLLAYYAALHKGTDIDQPRNLAKSVTVE